MVNVEKVTNCRFCAMPGSRKSLEEHDRPILETSKYFAVASLGGFIPGWTLVCPADHSLNLTQSYRDDAFIEFTEEVHGLLGSEFGPCVIFEHGSRTEGSLTGCGVNHAHLHLVPLRSSLVGLVARLDPSSQWIDASLSEVAALTSGREYLLMSDSYTGQSTTVKLLILNSPRSQYFRQILAEALNLKQLADYRVAPLKSEAGSVAERLRSASQAVVPA